MRRTRRSGADVTRLVHVAAAQLGPIARTDSREVVVARLVALMREARARSADLVVFPELALTTFFPRWWIDDESALDAFYETAMPSEATQPLFDAARELSIGFCLGYAELATVGGRRRRFNTAILVDARGRLVGKYRKVHLPGHVEHIPDAPFQHLEKRYFETGDLGFPAWRATFGASGVFGMAICNDRRWPETYRVLGLQGVEMILLGYNTPLHNPEAPEHDRFSAFHSRLVMQAGAYQNATWVVGVAKGGREEGVDQLADTVIVAPTGEVVAHAQSDGDELVLTSCDLDLGTGYRRNIFDFAAHREPHAYGLIVERKGAIAPPDDDPTAAER